MDFVRRFLKEEDGLGTVEIVMLILVLVGLAIVFREGMTDIIDSMIKKIKGDMGV